MSTQQKEFTLEQVSVLMWVKVLNDFEDPNCPGDTLDDKIEKFNNESADISNDVFENGLEKLCATEILQFNGEDSIYQLTAKGKTLMTALSAVKGFSDKTVQKLLNGTIKMKDFIKEHGVEILGIITNILFK